MGRIDKAYVYNAGSRDHTKPRIVHYKGERRRELWPAGRPEKFINLQGTVVQAVLVPPGVPVTNEALATARAKLHAHKTTDGDVVGFIEHGKCPLKSGVGDLHPTIAEEMERCREAIGPACKEHPVTFKRTKRGIEYFDGCPHVQWIIEERRKLHRAKSAARMSKAKTLQEIEKAKLEAAQQQAEATTRILERVAEKLDAAPTRTRKQSQEPSE